VIGSLLVVSIPCFSRSSLSLTAVHSIRLKGSATPGVARLQAIIPKIPLLLKRSLLRLSDFSSIMRPELSPSKQSRRRSYPLRRRGIDRKQRGWRSESAPFITSCIILCMEAQVLSQKRAAGWRSVSESQASFERAKFSSAFTRLPATSWRSRGDDSPIRTHQIGDRCRDNRYPSS
jgi:hypothetical protein